MFENSTFWKSALRPSSHKEAPNLNHFYWPTNALNCIKLKD